MKTNPGQFPTYKSLSPVLRNPATPIYLFAVVLIIGFADFSNDFSIAPGTDFYDPDLKVPIVTQYVQWLSTILIIILSLIGILHLLMHKKNYHARPDIYRFLLLFGIANVFGIIIGLLKEVQINNIIGDSRNILVYFLIFAFGTRNSERRITYLTNIFLFCCMILVAKIFIAAIIHYGLYNALSWRYLLKLNVFFPPMLFLALCLFVGDAFPQKKYKYLILVSLAAIGISASYSRGLFLGTGAGLFFIHLCFFNKKSIGVLVSIDVIIIAISIFFAILLQDDITKIFGDYTSDVYSRGLEYRIIQMNVFWDIFKNNWLVGAGLGSYDPSYLTYGDNVRPYIVELEYNNLLAKLGIIGIALLGSAFIFLFFGCFRMLHYVRKMKEKSLVVALTAGLISLLVSSITNACYSSVYFHLYVVLVLLVLSDIYVLNTQHQYMVK